MKKQLTLKFWTLAKTLLIIKQIKFINKKKFVKIILDKNIKIFIIYMFFFSFILIYLVKKYQIALLFIQKIDFQQKFVFFHIFLRENFLKLLKITNLNQYIIKLKKINYYFIGQFIVQSWQNSNIIKLILKQII